MSRVNACFVGEVCECFERGLEKHGIAAWKISSAYGSGKKCVSCE